MEETTGMLGNAEVWMLIGIIIGGIFGLLLFAAAVVKAFYRKVEQGRALIINKLSRVPTVTFTGGLVLPIIYKAELMDISLKTIEIDRRGKEGLICKDNIRADIKVAFYVRVNKTDKDVLQVAESVGCARASDQRTLEELFVAKFSEALKTVGKSLEFEDLYQQRDVFKTEIIKQIGKDLSGYSLEDAAIDYLEQTPVELLDANNILDSQGIRKITELTTQQNIFTNDFRQTERKEITRQNVDAEKAVLELQRDEADARAKQTREIETMKAREEAETRKVQAEEEARSESARIKAAEQVAIENENKLRQIEIAKKNRERAVLVEAERVERDRALEQVAREREVDLQSIEKDKALEIEKKAIADVVRERVAVDKKVAEEEERIKDVRAIEEAKRMKTVQVTAAEADAEEKLVKDIKEAEAAEEAAKFRARERLVLADAELEAAEREAQAKIRLAEGVQAQTAAPGLGNVRVREAEAQAIEKQGRAEAQVLEEKGLAEVRVKEQDAVAVEKQGRAEAVAIQAKLEGESAGLAKKAEAMKLLDEVSRDHEEFRLKLEQEKDIKLTHIEARRQIAEQQAIAMQKAFETAKINIVGGDGDFFDRFIKAVGVGQSLDAAIDNSSTLQTGLADYLEGGRSLPEDIREILSNPALGTEGLQHTSVSAFLLHLMRKADGETKEKLAQLARAAEQLGLDAGSPKGKGR
jgi:uncharacterized membrane protein YqiK